jgi:hypothetical protein
VQPGLERQRRQDTTTVAIQQGFFESWLGAIVNRSGHRLARKTSVEKLQVRLRTFYYNVGGILDLSQT